MLPQGVSFVPKIETLKARSLLTLEKINRAEGLSKDDKLKINNSVVDF